MAHSYTPQRQDCLLLSRFCFRASRSHFAVEGLLLPYGNIMMTPDHGQYLLHVVPELRELSCPLILNYVCGQLFLA